MNPIHQHAVECLTNGISVIPILPATGRGDKRPAVAWKPYTQHCATSEQADQWFTSDRYGIAVICGQVSGNLTMIELEGRAMGKLAELASNMQGSGLGSLWQTILTGWSENTPSGGMHFYIRTIQPAEPNRKLAMNTKREVLAETRGEGGYSITSPTPGQYHHTGIPWKRITGGPTTIPTLTTEQVEDLYAIITATLNEYHPGEHATLGAPTTEREGDRPGDQYENTTTWSDILTPHGWQLVFTQGNTTYWRRPGKTSGISATTGHNSDRDRLYVFTTSTIFQAETPYTKFGAYALLNHNGDYQQAARQLANDGYGTPNNPGDIIIDLPLTPLPQSAEQDSEDDMPPVSGSTVQDEENEADDLPPTWEPADLAPYLDGTYTPPTPTLFTRTDHVALFYPGLVHDIHGESESGKSLLIQTECAHQLQQGNKVAYIDYESDAGQIIERLTLMGCTHKHISGGLTYIRPEQSPYSPREQHAFRALLTHEYTLVIIDGVTDALTQEGAASKDNDDIARWHRYIPRVIARHTGAAVVLIDHVTKNTDTRGRFAIGGQTKMAAIDGASYLAEVIHPLGRGMKGTITLRVAKDRPGSIRPKSGTYRPADRTQEAARIIIDSTDPSKIITTVNPPDATQENTGIKEFRPVHLMEKLSRIIEEYKTPISITELKKTYREDGGKAKNETILGAVNILLNENYLIEKEGPRNSRLLRSAHVYRAESDGIPVGGVARFHVVDGGQE